MLRLLTAGSVEERICTAAAKKLAVADRSITGGFFDGKTQAAQRRAYLLGLLHVQEGSAAAPGNGVDQLRWPLHPPLHYHLQTSPEMLWLVLCLLCIAR